MTPYLGPYDGASEAPPTIPRLSGIKKQRALANQHCELSVCREQSKRMELDAKPRTTISHFIHNQTFSDLKLLEVLRLDGNRLHLFPVWQLSMNPYLVRITLTNNNWSCHCQYLREFRTWLRINFAKVTDALSVTCVLRFQQSGENTDLKQLGPHLADFNSSACSSYLSGVEWCRFEFKSAFREAMQRDIKYNKVDKNIKRLIIIIFGDLPSRDLDPDMRIYLNKTAVCIKWGDSRFWEKLRHAMPATTASTIIDSTGKNQAVNLRGAESLKGSLYYCCKQAEGHAGSSAGGRSVTLGRTPLRAPDSPRALPDCCDPPPSFVSGARSMPRGSRPHLQLHQRGSNVNERCKVFPERVEPPEFYLTWSETFSTIRINELQDALVLLYTINCVYNLGQLGTEK
ncbi:hypothetical protein B566_EDAN014601 [Ephemera danica]|nr:hypothetical protein B566_EDAN014601 [Ephemera danica]